MPRVNLSINENMYVKIQEEADRNGVSVNNYVFNVIARHFDDCRFDLIEVYHQLRNEALEIAYSTDKKFTLNDCPTYQGIEEQLSKVNYPETAKQVKVRLSMMFKENVGDDFVITSTGKYMYIEKAKLDKEKVTKRLIKYSNGLNKQ